MANKGKCRSRNRVYPFVQIMLKANAVQVPKGPKPDASKKLFGETKGAIMEKAANEKQTAALNQLLYMQIRILRMFCQRHDMSINAASRIFEENQIFSLIEFGWDGYHCGGDELVYEDMENILKRRGAIA